MSQQFTNFTTIMQTMTIGRSSADGFSGASNLSAARACDRVRPRIGTRIIVGITNHSCSRPLPDVAWKPSGWFIVLPSKQPTDTGPLRFFAPFHTMAPSPSPPPSIPLCRVEREERDKLEYMEIDSETASDGDHSGKRRQPDPKSTAKARAVSGPQREVPDDVRYNESYHKDQATFARDKAQRLLLENQRLLAQLAEAQMLKAQTDDYMLSLRQDIDSKTRVIADLQHSEGELSAQCFQDQQRIDALRNECQTVFPQLQEAHKLLLERNAHVDHLTRLLQEKQDETFQLCAANIQRGKKAAQNPPPPRRGTRASMDPVRNSSTRMIQIPLNPVGGTKPPRGKSNSKQPKSKGVAAVAELVGTDANTLTDLIGKLERLLVDDDGVSVTIDEPTPKVPKVPQQLLNFIHKGLRNAAYECFEVTQAADFAIYNKADPAHVDACEEGVADPAADLFQWDFDPGYKDCRWNELMISKVVDATLKADGRNGRICKAIERDLFPRDYLEGLMKEKLERYRGAWKGFQPRFTESLDRMETVREAKDRGAEAYLQHQLSCRSRTTKARKLDERIAVTTSTIEIKLLDATIGDIATWQRLLEMLKHLGVQGMSSEDEDEVEVEDTKVRIFRVKLCIWREPTVVELLRFVDAQAAVFKEHQRGPEPATRIRGREHGSGKAPCGLPQSLYNPEWLKTKSKAYIKELKISKEVFGLFVAATDRMAI
ncbi:hypothetical protein C8R43DRAFT_963218 [Mycena crocata]|nr:hypothetical protein C8R43DRAFT_963218 [Mycena crocata]